jgi:hypothetical protein
MRSAGKVGMRVLPFGAVILAVLGLGIWRMSPASGQGVVTSVVAPSTWPVDGGEFEVRVRAENVTNLGSYEFQLAFDPELLEFKGIENGQFLGSSGRSTACPPAIVGPDSHFQLEDGNVRFGCGTLGLTPPGPDGSGVLAILTFSPRAAGAADLELVWVSLSDPNAGDISTQRQSGCVAVGAGTICVEPTVAPPAVPTPRSTPPPTATATDSTPTEPAPTEPAPTEPVATPTPLPPGWEALPLLSGCQFETWTGEDGTAPGKLPEFVGPATALESLWAMQPPPVWRGYSPEFPEVSDLEPVGLLDVLAICMRSPGDFVRPII